tara:strand:+ start:9395 stop:9667 length:273 start_codon:yes stop_codon:yes gene_type:complete
MGNFLKENNYKHDQAKVVPLSMVIKHHSDKTLQELTNRIDELNLLTIVLKREINIDEHGFEIILYTCVDNYDLLTLRILQGVKVVHAVVL